MTGAGQSTVNLTVVRESGLVPVFIDRERCDGCGRCLSRCSTGALSLDAAGKAAVDITRCLGVGGCLTVCPVRAIGWAAA